jgi:hypothetical protein
VPTGSKYAKRTQFPAGGGWDEAPGGVGGASSMQNEANFGVKACETNPISPGRRGLAEENVQNEAKLGWTGVYGKRGLSCGARLGRGVKRAKRSQFPAGAGGTSPPGAWAERQVCRTKPISSGHEFGLSAVRRNGYESQRGLGLPGKQSQFARPGRWWPQGGLQACAVHTSQRAWLDNPLRRGPESGRLRRDNYAEQSQFLTVEPFTSP